MRWQDGGEVSSIESGAAEQKLAMRHYGQIGRHEKAWKGARA